MRGPDKRRSLWRPNSRSNGVSFIFDEEQLYNKSMQNANSPETERMRGPKKRGSLRRPKLACF